MTRLHPREEAQWYLEKNYLYGRGQPRKISVAEAEARRQEQQSQANPQAAKTLKRRREEPGMSFTSVCTAARLQRQMGSKFGVLKHVIYHNVAQFAGII